MKTGAEFSDDRVYRYKLTREWGGPGGNLVVIGLNPSTADETVDDPTIRRCISFAKREGCSGLIMLNLFAFRSTDPGYMKLVPHPVAHPDTVHENDKHIALACAGGKMVAAWGAHGGHRDRDQEVRRLIATRGRKLYVFGFTKAGHPRHPLYLRNDTPLVEWNDARA